MAFSFDQLPDDAFIRQRDLAPPSLKDGPGILPFTAQTLFRRVRAGTFPAPIRLTGGRATAWRVRDVREWLRAQGGGQ